MYKELVICIITVVVIIVGNIIGESFTESSVHESTEQLSELKKELFSSKELKEKLDNKEIAEEFEDNNEANENEVTKTNQKAKEQVDNIHQKWDEKYNILAFYLEHNELEKIETELTGLRASIEFEDYDQAVNELDKTVYLLKHVEEKNKLSWKNIF